jgi:hypothetical protein
LLVSLTISEARTLRLISLDSADIIKSARTVAKPRLDFFACLSAIDYNQTLAAVHRLDHPLRQLGGGFFDVRWFRSSKKFYRLQHALQCLALYTRAVDDYFAGRGLAQNLGLLSEERTFVTHNLLSLTPDLDKPSQKGDELFDLCHVAAVIYTLLCVFPVPAAPFARLTLRIKDLLMRYKFTQEWSEAPRLMLWITFIAGIATTGLEDESTRSWFIRVLDWARRRAAIEIIDSWEDLRDGLLLHFLWLPITNDRDGEDLWREIEEWRPFDTG